MSPAPDHLSRSVLPAEARPRLVSKTKEDGEALRASREPQGEGDSASFRIGLHFLSSRPSFHQLFTYGSSKCFLTACASSPLSPGS